MSVSVVIPAYNSAPYLEAAIRSALEQTEAPREVILIDDGSTDGSEEVYRPFGDRVACRHCAHRGVSISRNAGAALARGEWLLFLDADDRLLPEAVATLTRRARRGDFGVVYGQTIYFHEATGARRLHGVASSEGPPPAAARASFWKSAIATPGAALIRADLFSRVGGFVGEFFMSEDRDLWMKSGMFAAFGFAAAPVLEKREHASNVSRRRVEALRQAAIVQLAFFEWCRAQGLDAPFLDASPAAVLDNALRKALDEESIEGVRSVLALAREHAIVSDSLSRAARFEWLSPRGAALRLRARATWRRVLSIAGK